MVLSFTWPHHLTFITISKTCVCGEDMTENEKKRHDKKKEYKTI